MRSVGGGFDNESSANTAMVLILIHIWFRSLRNDTSAWMGSEAGLAKLLYGRSVWRIISLS
jgi:hypothetical protein